MTSPVVVQRRVTRGRFVDDARNGSVWGWGLWYRGDRNSLAVSLSLLPIRIEDVVLQSRRTKCWCNPARRLNAG